MYRLEGSFVGKVWADGTARLQPLNTGRFDASKLISDADGTKYRYIRKLLWEAADWSVAIKTVHPSNQLDPDTPWLVVIDSNVARTHFTFADPDQTALKKFERDVRSIAGRLPQLDLKAEVQARRQSRGRMRVHRTTMEGPSRAENWTDHA
jgi:hypothetical protein